MSLNLRVTKYWTHYRGRGTSAQAYGIKVNELRLTNCFPSTGAQVFYTPTRPSG